MSTEKELPAPFIERETDLRGYEFMPLYGDRLFGSETWIAGTAEAKIAALRLWWRSYAKEVPAGSLPDNDSLLAEYAGYGAQLKAWRKVKPQAMRGWTKCSDGLLYHSVVCELAKPAWDERVKASVKGKAGAAKRWGKTHSTGNAAAMATANATTINSDSQSNTTGNARAIARERIGEDRTGQSSAAREDLPANVKLATWLTAQGLQGANGHDPRIVTLAAEGVTEQEVIEAVRIARVDRGKGEKPFHFAYVLGIISDIRNPPERRNSANWRANDESIDAKGREIGIAPERGETYAQYADRIALKLASVSRGTEAAA